MIAATLVLHVALTASSFVQQTAPTDADSQSASDRGIAGALNVDTKVLALRAKPEQSLNAPLLARVARSERDPDGRVRNRVEFIGTVAGDFDLRPLLEFVDGTSAESLPPIMVHIESTLPENPGSDLFGGTTSDLLRPNWYRATLVVLGVAWLAIPVIVLVRARLRRARVLPPPATEPAPTFADQLRPLVRAALDGSLSTAGHGQLELLLYSYWRERLGLDAVSQPEAVSTLRHHPEAGRILVAVERWLHDAPRADHAGSNLRSMRPDSEIESLLAPYRDAQPVAAGALDVVAGRAGIETGARA